MQNHLAHVQVREQQLFIDMLTALQKEEGESSGLFNKKLLIRLFTLKINQPNKFKEIKGGHANDTYHYADENLVLRFPKRYNPIYHHASIEVQNLIQAKCLDLTPLCVIAYYAKYSLLVTQFIPSYQSLSAADFKNPAKLVALAHLVKKLHYSQFTFKKNPETTTSFIDQSSKTFQTIKPILNKKDYAILKKLSGIKNFLTKSKCLKRPSHGDLHHFNVIEINGGLQLIDWELSSVEDPAYDISRLFCVSDLNIEQKEIFLRAYQTSYGFILSALEIKNLIKRIHLFTSLNYFSIAIWARYMMPFFNADKKKLLQEVILNTTEKDRLIAY
jgi:thiamine kinase-like enzyme